MDIKEYRDQLDSERKQLAQELLQHIKEFEKRTGCLVSSIDIDTYTQTIRNETIRLTVGVEVHLDVCL